jgi:hypothetical protein
MGPASIECIADSLAAICDLARRPRLLGNEMVSAIEGLECSSDIKVVETRSTAEAPATSKGSTVLSLGTEGRKKLTLVCKIPDDPVKAILLADVLRIGRAALELERARENERNRAALWPANPVEEQAALFMKIAASAQRIAPPPFI